jgi:putative flippase GtrA
MVESARDEAVRIAKFLAGGAVNTAIGGGGAILALQWIGLGPHLANAGGYALGVPCGYLLNRLFVFESRDPAGARAAHYLGAVAVAFLANQLVLSVLTAFSASGSHTLAQLAALATYTVILFLLCRFWIFVGSLRKAVGRIYAIRPIAER